MASVPDLPAWYAQLDPSVSPVVMALLTSQDTEGTAEQMRLEALTAQLSFTDGLDAWLGLSQAYQVIGHRKASYSLLCQILAVYPEQPRALAALAIFLAERGQLPEAIAYYEQALIFTPEDAWIRKNYGVTLYRAGKKEQARKQWQYIVENGDEDEIEASAALLAKFG